MQLPSNAHVVTLDSRRSNSLMARLLIALTALCRVIASHTLAHAAVIPPRPNDRLRGWIHRRRSRQQPAGDCWLLHGAWRSIESKVWTNPRVQRDLVSRNPVAVL